MFVSWSVVISTSVREITLVIYWKYTIVTNTADASYKFQQRCFVDKSQVVKVQQQTATSSEFPGEKLEANGSVLNNKEEALYNIIINY